jgi:hypothetical protein
MGGLSPESKLGTFFTFVAFERMNSPPAKYARHHAPAERVSLFELIWPHQMPFRPLSYQLHVSGHVMIDSPVRLFSQVEWTSKMRHRRI